MLISCLNRIVMVFFFKQMTAYEMRISDWSSDVCSSDLKPVHSLFLLSRPSDQRLDGGVLGIDCGLPGNHRLGVRSATDDHPGRPFALGTRAAKCSDGRRVGQECVSTGRYRRSTKI